MVISKDWNETLRKDIDNDSMSFRSPLIYINLVFSLQIIGISLFTLRLNAIFVSLSVWMVIDSRADLISQLVPTWLQSGLADVTVCKTIGKQQ